jgi:hypothetical protein
MLFRFMQNWCGIGIIGLRTFGLCLLVGTACFRGYAQESTDAVMASTGSENAFIFVTDYDPTTEASVFLPDSRLRVYECDLEESAQGAEVKSSRVVFDLFEYWKNTISYLPSSASEYLRGVEGYYRLERGISRVEYSQKHNIAWFELQKRYPDKVTSFEQMMCFVRGDSAEGTNFFMVNVHPKRSYSVGFVDRPEGVYVSLLDIQTPCEMRVFNLDEPEGIRVTTNYLDFYGDKVLLTEGDMIYFRQGFPILLADNLSPSPEERVPYEKSARVRLPLQLDRPFPPYLKRWIVEANLPDRLVLREFPPLKDDRVGVEIRLDKADHQAVVTIMKEKNAQGLNPVVWDEEVFTPSVRGDKLGSTSKYDLKRTDAGEILRVEKGGKSSTKVDVEKGTHVLPAGDRVFTRKSWNSEGLRMYREDDFFNASKAERASASASVTIHDKGLREDMKGLLRIMPVRRGGPGKN